MPLHEKILQLRTQLGLSQMEIAEQLGVSRQSVSKWETGQSVPDLDKLIKLSDLFGVSVDELVREEERPQPPKPEPQVVYVREKHALSGTQRAGICGEVSGLVLGLLGLAGWGAIPIVVGAALILLGLPLLLARKHPWLIAGWMAVGLSLLIFNPYYSVAPWGLFGGIRELLIYLEYGDRYISYLIGGAVGVSRGLLTLVLLCLTGRAMWKTHKTHKKRA